METTIMGYVGFLRDNGREHGNYYRVQGVGFFRGNGKENGNYYRFRV